MKNNMTDIIAFFDRLSPLTPEAKTDLQAAFLMKDYEKGEYVLKHGEICRHLLFVKSGLVKLSSLKDGSEFIMRFFPENSLFTQIDSFSKQQASIYSILALENSEIIVVNYTDLNALVKKHHCIETLYRKLMVNASINMMMRISEMLEDRPEQRYRNFLEDQKHLINRISLGDLARYIGISQVSLSRIRNKIAF